jgi:hypothetical protein
MIKVERLDIELDPTIQERISKVYAEHYAYHCLGKFGHSDIEVDGVHLKDNEEFCTWSSDTNRFGHRVWEDELTLLIWNLICDAWNIDAKSYVERCYLNLQTYKQMSYWHQDNDNTKETIIYYPSINYNGKHNGTEFLINDKIVNIPYITGSAIRFNSNLWHRGLDTDNKLNPRNVLVFHSIDKSRVGNKMFEGTKGFDYD